MSSIVNEFNNVTKPIIEKILHLYSIFGSSIYKIQNELKEEHNVDISHQTIERILIALILIKSINRGLFQAITCLTVFGSKLKENGSTFWPYSTLK